MRETLLADRLLSSFLLSGVWTSLANSIIIIIMRAFGHTRRDRVQVYSSPESPLMPGPGSFHAAATSLRFLPLAARTSELCLVSMGDHLYCNVHLNTHLIRIKGR